MGFKNLKDAANELQSVRNELASGHADLDALQARVDTVGQWVAGNGKPTGLSAKILQEAHSLNDRLAGGSGKPGVRMAV